jgi:outer membrane protein TolC
MYFRWVLWIGINLLITQFVFAEKYNLDGILKLAIEQNKDIKLAESELKTASALKMEAFADAFPQFDVVAGYNYNIKENVIYTGAPPGSGIPDKLKISFANEFSFNAVVRQTLFSFNVGTAIQAAGIYQKFTDYQFDNQRQAVITEVKKAFYRVLLAKQGVEVAQDSEDSAKENYETTKLRFEAGAASEFDLLQSEVRWQNTIPITIEFRKNYELAFNNLKVLVAIPLEREIDLEGTLELYPPIPDKLQFEEVAENRPDYIALQWEKRLQEKNVENQYANFLPSLSASFAYTFSSYSDQLRLERQNDNFILGLNLSVPIFTGGRNIALVRKAKAEEEKVKTRLSKANDDIRLQLDNIHLRMREANERILAARKSVNIAERTFELAESQAQSGLITQVELKENRVALDQAKVNYFSAIYDYLESYFDWERAIGRVRTSYFDNY